MRTDGSAVAIESGTVLGHAVAAGDVRAFLGIPFAAPPVGPLRWRAPMPAAEWTQPLVADRTGPMPMQRLSAGDSIFGANGALSEDCLQLNVWTPARATTAPLPVMVWVHGGGHMSGSGTLPQYSGAGLARKGAVVVTLNYRVASLGFLAHPEISAESGSGTSGNFGLLDIIAALEWVQRNIANFGGAPDQVTLFGQSAGASLVLCLMTSPRTKGLFHRAIVQSPGPLKGPDGRMTRLAAAEQRGLAFAEELGCKSLAELRNMPADALVAAPGFMPIADGIVIPDDVHAVFARGGAHPLPLLGGWNRDEGTAYLQPDHKDEFVAALKRKFGELADALLALYPIGSDADVARAAAMIMRDEVFAWSAESSLRGHAAGGSKAFLYEFEHCPPFPARTAMREHVRGAGAPGMRQGRLKSDREFGAYHGAEIVYALDNFDAVPSPWRDVDRRLAETMSDCWLAFARTGDPNHGGLPAWPAYDRNRRLAMHFGERIEAGPISNRAGVEFFDALYRSNDKSSEQKDPTKRAVA